VKPILTLSVLFFLISSCSSNSKKKNDLFYDQIKGKVSKVTMAFYTFSDSSGEIKKGKIADEYILDFNHDGNLIHQKVISIEGGVSKVIEETIFKYNDKGLQVAAQHPPNPKPYITDLYDNKGQLKTIYLLDDQRGVVLKISKFIRYNLSLSEYDDYLPNGNLENKTIYKSNGDSVTQVKKYDAKGKLNEQNKFAFAADGKLATREYMHNGETLKTTFKYSNIDSEGNYLTTISYSNGKPYRIEERTLVYY
jgi:hypothetical protein